MSNRSIFTYSCAVTLLFLSVSSTAQGAEAAVAAEPVLEEIVITAQKRIERLQDVTVSAAVVSSDTISKLNAGDISDLNRLVPSVNLSGSINGRVPMGVRGVSSVASESAVGLSSGVALMIDGVPIPSDSRAGNALEDVQSIEVLKGPQATLGGRTAAQGVINVVTRKPTDTLTGSVTLMGTDDSEYRGNGFISGPIGNSVRVSLSAYYTTREFPIKNLKLDKNTTEKVYGARGKLLFQPNEDLDITLAARVGRDNSDGFNFVYTHLTPGIHLLTGVNGPPFLTQAYLLPGITPSFTNLNYSSPVDAYSNVRDTDGSVDVSYRIGGLTLGSTTAYQRETQVNVQDLFAVDTYFFNQLTGGSPTSCDPQTHFCNSQMQQIKVRQFSEELKLVSPADQAVSYVLGLFYSDTKVDLRTDRTLPPALVQASVSPVTKTTDLYGRATWKLAPKTALITGLRYNYDQIGYDYTEDAYAAGGGVVYHNLTATDSSRESTVVGDVSVQQKFGEDSMVYLSYTRGYAPAAYNTAQALTPTAPKVGRARKEDIDQFELGVKGSLLSGRVTLNAALFDTKYKGFQVQIYDQTSTSINPPLILANAGGAETRGLELDAAFAATDRLRIDINAAVIDAKFTDYFGAPCYYAVSVATKGFNPAGCIQVNNGQIVTHPGEATNAAYGPVVQDLSGKPMPNAPKFKAVLGMEQSVPLPNASELVLGGNYSYRSSAMMLADQNPYARQRAFGILNLSIGWRTADRKTSATVFANNVTNQIYYADLEDFWSSPWGGSATVIGQPARDAQRYFGLRLSQSF